MRIVFEQRAATVLYQLLRGRRDPRPWLLPSNVCPIVPLTFLKAGAAVEWIDIDPETLCIDARELLHRVTQHPDRYAGALFVHTYGRPQPVQGLIAAIHQVSSELLFIDDRCLEFPQFSPPTSGADVTLFSSGYAKPVDIGFGGFGYINDGVPYDHEQLEFNEEALTTITQRYKESIAAGRPIRSAEGDWLDTREPELSFDDYRARIERSTQTAIQHRETLRAIYREQIPSRYMLPAGEWRTHIRIPERDRFLRSLFEANLFAGDHYAPVSMIFGENPAPVASALHAEIVNLFDDRYYSPEQAERSCAVLKDHLAQCR
jgi:hypothetical protein